MAQLASGTSLFLADCGYGPREAGLVRVHDVAAEAMIARYGELFAELALAGASNARVNLPAFTSPALERP